MLLVSATVGPFKSIEQPLEVAIEEDITVLVGMNEAGKTVFLQALAKSADVLDVAAFDVVEDYPRRLLTQYAKVHGKEPARATTLTYELDEEETAKLNESLGCRLVAPYRFSVSHQYDNTLRMALNVDEAPIAAALIASADLSSDAKSALESASTLAGILAALKDVELTASDTAFRDTIQKRIAAAESGMTKTNSSGFTVAQWEAWQWLKPRIPRFLYFGDYQVLDSKVNLADLATQAAADPKQLSDKYRGALALLRMADISVADLAAPGGYEPLKAKIEAVSINLTDQIMEFWKQNEDLEVEVDIKPDPNDAAPFNNGPNLYLRIKNRRHRGVSTPFHQRSRGFVWFFSFLVWFDSVQNQIGVKNPTGRELILLLDEPGLSLHALAQADFLKYIDNLSDRHQVIYTTHSPFMVHSDRLGEVRVVEDRVGTGTVISPVEGSGANARTLFPLQAALGYTVAQNLFISERNLLVEGPSELIYLQLISALQIKAGKTGLRDDVTIVPTGGLGNVVTFIALLGASGLKLAVLHDYKGSPDQKLNDLVRQKMIAAKSVLNAAQFREGAPASLKPSDIEDLFTPKTYLEMFNEAFASQLGKKPITEKALPKGDRIVVQIETALASAGVQLRPSGGFNHYTVAAHFAASPTKLDDDTLTRFEALFKAINALFQ